MRLLLDRLSRTLFSNSTFFFLFPFVFPSQLLIIFGIEPSFGAQYNGLLFMALGPSHLLPTLIVDLIVD